MTGTEPTLHPLRNVCRILETEDEIRTAIVLGFRVACVNWWNAPAEFRRHLEPVTHGTLWVQRGFR
jgi:hypothetical protein